MFLCNILFAGDNFIGTFVYVLSETLTSLDHVL